MDTRDLHFIADKLAEGQFMHKVDVITMKSGESIPSGLALLERDVVVVLDAYTEKHTPG